MTDNKKYYLNLICLISYHYNVMGKANEIVTAREVDEIGQGSSNCLQQLVYSVFLSLPVA